MNKHWNQWTAGILSGFALGLVLTGCEAKKNESSQAPADQPQSMANPSETRDAPIAPAPPAAERPGAAGQQ
jgi:hypothetical protein